VTITAVCPGALEVSEVVLEWRPAGGSAWQAVPMCLVGRRTYAVEFVMPAGSKQVEYRVRAVFAAAPAPLVAVAPPAGGRLAYVISA
jgi:hypothetical protein